MSACTCMPPRTLKDIYLQIASMIKKQKPPEDLEADETDSISGTLKCRVCGQWYVWTLNVVALPHDLGAVLPWETDATMRTAPLAT